MFRAVSFALALVLCTLAWSTAHAAGPQQVEKLAFNALLRQWGATNPAWLSYELSKTAAPPQGASFKDKMSATARDVADLLGQVKNFVGHITWPFGLYATCGAFEWCKAMEMRVWSFLGSNKPDQKVPSNS